MLKSDFTVSQILTEIESQFLVSGLERAIGLHLLNQSLMLSFERRAFLGKIDWMLKAMDTHYLNGLDTCLSFIKDSLTDQFS